MSDAQHLGLAQRLDPWANGIGSGMNDLYTPFLGPLATQEKTNPYELRPVDKFNMPEAYLGKNLFLRDTINDWLFTASQTWYTTRIMPWRVTEEIHMAWTQWETNAHFLGIVPEQATSRLVTQERSLRRASLIRRGIGYEFEHGFVSTAMGRASFMAAMGQMSRSVQETMNAEVIRALVNSYRHLNQFLRDHGIIKQGDLDKFLKRDRDRFALVQKVKNGMAKMDADINAEMLVMGGKANAWIMTEDVSIYCTFVRDEVTDFYKAGANGPARINNEPMGKMGAAGGTMGELDRIEPLHFVRNVPVFIARSFVGGSQGEMLDLLSRTRQVGEYNTMFDDTTDWANYKSCTRDIGIYVMTEDKFIKVSVSQALRACGRFDLGTGAVKIARRNRQGDTSAHEQDYDQDFLTFMDHSGPTAAEQAAGSDERKAWTASGGKTAVRYVGDMSYEFLESDFLRNVGRPVSNALMRQGIDETTWKAVHAEITRSKMELRNTDTISWDKLGGITTAATATQPAVYAKAQNLQNAFNLLASALQGILGTNNLFFDEKSIFETLPTSNPPGEENTTPGQMFWRLFAAQGATPVQRSASGSTNIVRNTRDADKRRELQPKSTEKLRRRGGDEPEPAGASISGNASTSKLDSALLNSLMAGIVHREIPEATRKTISASIQSIVDQPGVSALDKAEQIRDAAYQLVDEKTPGLRWNNHAAVKDWYDTRAKAYQQAVASQVHVGAEAMEQDDEEAEPVQETMGSGIEFGYAMPGQQLRDGWTYVHSAAAQRQARVSNSPIPNCAAAIPFVADAVDARNSAGATQTRSYRGRQDQDERGFGLSQVGTMAYDPSARGTRQTTNSASGGRADKLFGQSAERFRNLGELLGRLAEFNMNALEKICAMLYLGCQMQLPVMLSLVDNDVPIPFGFIIARPHMQVRTRTAIKVAMDGECGNAFFGHSNLQIAHSAQIKTGLVHYTCYMGAVVHNPKNVYVQPDVMCHDYMGGCDYDFWDAESYKSNTWGPQIPVNRSIICMAVPFAEQKMPNPMDISGRFYTEYKAGLMTRDRFQQLQYSTAYFYNQDYGFFDANSRRRGSDQPSLTAGRAHVNRIMWAGAQLSWNASKGDFTRYRPNTGHFGPTYQGVAAVRVGSKNEQMRDADTMQHVIG